MIPFLLAAVGGYLIGQSRKDEKFADGGKISSSDWENMNYSDQVKYIKKNGEQYIGGTYYTVIGNDIAEIEQSELYGDGWHGALPNFYDASYDDGRWNTFGDAKGNTKEQVIDSLKEIYSKVVVERYFDKEMQDLVPIKLPIKEIDSMFYVGDFVDVDGSGWVTEKEAKRAIADYLYENLEVIGPKK